MSDNILKMVTGTMPINRNYTLFRNVVELRDFRRGILQLQETMRNLGTLEKALKVPSHRISKIRALKTSLRDIPKEYVGYHFGWAQTYRDVTALMLAPDKITKQINWLMSRNGKDTTYRTKRDFPSALTGISGFDYDNLSGEYALSIESKLERETQLRLVINANYRFPDVDLPNFKKHLFREKLGIYPSITDIYNLVPWTWLLDWFTGVGNYVEIIDNLNHDPTLINWGMLTGVIKGKLTTDFKSKSDNWSRVYVNNVQVSESQNTIQNAHTSTCEYTLQLRKDVSNLPNVHSTSDISSMTAYQASILGGIISQSTKHRLHF